MTLDVLVIGAGPAGSTTAKKIAERGFQVLVLEKNSLYREKPCAGAVTNRVVEHFKIPEKVFTRKCQGIFLCGPKNNSILLGNNPKIRFTMRSIFDKTLCEIAMDKGAEFIEKSLVTEPVIKNKKIIGVKTKIDGKTKIINAKLVIAADGTPSTIAKKLDLYSNKLNTIGFSYQYQMKLSNEKIEQRIGSNAENYFGSHWIPSGYSWIFPKKDMVTVGCVTKLEVVQQRRINLKQNLDHFIKNHPIASPKLEDAKVVKCQAQLIGYPGVLKNNVVDGCLIVGDASGTVSLWTSEGIWYSMMSGEAAGLSAAELLETDDVSANNIRLKYFRNLDQRVIDDLRFASKLMKFVDSDIKQQRIIAAISKDQWWANLLESLMLGSCTYKDALKQIRMRPDKIIKAGILYR